MNEEQIHELLYQALETEKGGVEIYRTALRCAVNEELKTEWEEYLSQTETHVEVLQEVFSKLELDPETPSPGRDVVRTKDHLNWELIGMLAGKLKDETGKALKEAHDEVEEEEDEHLYHTAGWSRELWIQSVGMPAVLPPPEEERDVKTAIGAARAKQERNRMKKAG